MVSLLFRADASYSYAVTQSETPAWKLAVEGKYSVGTAPPNNDQASLAVTLTPTSITATGLTDANRQDELNRLQIQGFPGIIAQSYLVSWDRLGNMSLKAFGASVSSIYKPGAAITPSLSIVNAATFTAGPVAPGSSISIFGTFSIKATSATSLPLPASLNGVSVTINGKTSPLLYVGPSQINAQVPFEIGAGAFTATVSINGVQQGSGPMSIVNTAPGIFVDSATGRAVAANQDYSLNTPQHPAKVGTYITIYFTGQGALTPAIATGAAGPTSTLSRTSATIRQPSVVVALPWTTAVRRRVLQLWLRPISRSPPGLAAGDHPLVIAVGGVVSNSGKVSITP